RLADDGKGFQRGRYRAYGADEARRHAGGNSARGGIPLLGRGGISFGAGAFRERGHGMTRVAVVIPAYNEAGTIREIAERTLRQVPWLIVVDDGSTDGTAAAVADLPLTLLRNPENRGKGASLWRGIAHAIGEDAEVIVTLDGDAQHLPEDIPRLLAAHAGR